MNSAAGDSVLDLPIDLDSTTNTTIDYSEESIEQLLDRANSMITEIRQTIKTPVRRAPATTVTLQASNEMESAIARDTPFSISINDEDDDDVIFVGEERLIDLCSPDKGPGSSVFQSKANGNEADDPHENKVMCAVCIDSAVGRNPHSTKCGHIFCGECIKNAIKINRKCPMCNKTLSLSNIFPVYL